MIPAEYTTVGGEKSAFAIQKQFKRSAIHVYLLCSHVSCFLKKMFVLEDKK